MGEPGREKFLIFDFAHCQQNFPHAPRHPFSRNGPDFLLKIPNFSLRFAINSKNLFFDLFVGFQPKSCHFLSGIRIFLNICFSEK